MTQSRETQLPRASIDKLPPIPQGARIQKRPLTSLQQPASSKRPIIYVSSRTPFMAVVKRARKMLDKSLRNTSAAPRNASLHSRVEALTRNSADGGGGKGTVVRIMATGKAIERTVSVAGWFQQQGDCVVEMRTRTMATVDDVVIDDDGDGEGGFGGDGDTESRLRKLSVLELSVSLK